MILGFALALTFPQHAPRDWPITGGWSIAEVHNRACGMSQKYEGAGSTSLMLFLELNGDVMVIVQNDKWNGLGKGANFTGAFEFDQTTYEGVAVGADSTTGGEFVARFKPSFLDDIAKSSGLTIRRGETIVDDLSLKGSGAAVAVLRQCLSGLRARLAAEELARKRLEHIPENPFEDLPKK